MAAVNVADVSMAKCAICRSFSILVQSRNRRTAAGTDKRAGRNMETKLQELKNS